MRHQLYSTLEEFSDRTGLDNNVPVRTCIMKQFNVRCHMPGQFLTSKVEFIPMLWLEENPAYLKFPLTLFGCDAEGKVTASFGPVSTLYPSNSFPHLNKPQAVPSPLPLWDLEEDCIQANDSEMWESTKGKEAFSRFQQPCFMFVMNFFESF